MAFVWSLFVSFAAFKELENISAKKMRAMSSTVLFILTLVKGLAFKHSVMFLTIRGACKSQQHNLGFAMEHKINARRMCSATIMYLLPASSILPFLQVL